ncbi:MAG: MerR family transcriptional regulator, partial [Lachnospiraceae bacterium]|nr:MerR family transcriptional regulator [Lachnospiraceae bacterium]
MRKSNGYREYHQKEIDVLKKIKLLRKLGVPVEEIKKVLEQSISLDDCLEKQ